MKSAALIDARFEAVRVVSLLNRDMARGGELARSTGREREELAAKFADSDRVQGIRDAFKASREATSSDFENQRNEAEKRHEEAIAAAKATEDDAFFGGGVGGANPYGYRRLDAAAAMVREAEQRRMDDLAAIGANRASALKSLDDNMNKAIADGGDLSMTALQIRRGEIEHEERLDRVRFKRDMAYGRVANRALLAGDERGAARLLRQGERVKAKDKLETKSEIDAVDILFNQLDQLADRDYEAGTVRIQDDASYMKGLLQRRPFDSEQGRIRAKYERAMRPLIEKEDSGTIDDLEMQRLHELRDAQKAELALLAQNDADSRLLRTTSLLNRRDQMAIIAGGGPMAGLQAGAFGIAKDAQLQADALMRRDARNAGDARLVLETGVLQLHAMKADFMKGITAEEGHVNRADLSGSGSVNIGQAMQDISRQIDELITAINALPNKIGVQ